MAERKRGTRLKPMLITILSNILAISVIPLQSNRLNIRMYVCIYVCMYVCMYVCVCMCVCERTVVYTCVIECG